MNATRYSVLADISTLVVRNGGKSERVVYASTVFSDGKNRQIGGKPTLPTYSVRDTADRPPFPNAMNL